MAKKPPKRGRPKTPSSLHRGNRLVILLTDVEFALVKSETPRGERPAATVRRFALAAIERVRAKAAE